MTASGRYPVNGLMDDADRRILAGIAHVARIVDPVPEGLAERSLFAITVAALDVEVMEPAIVPQAEDAVRGGATDPVEARTITFIAESLTIMISLSTTDDGCLRIDGYAAPGTRLVVELRRPSATMATRTDEDGRFVLEAVEPGPASLVVRPVDGGRRAVSTPVIEL